MKKIGVVIPAKAGIQLLAFLCLLVTPPSARAQFIGYTAPQTIQQTLAAAGTACTGSAQTFAVRSFGQGNHYAEAQPLGTTSFQMEIDGIDSAGNIYRISDAQRASPGYSGSAISGYGYYPSYQVKVTCTPVAGTFTLSYSGGSAISQINTGTYLISQIDKIMFSGISASSNQTDTFETPFGNSLGILMFSYVTSSVSNSTLTIGCSATQAGSVTVGQNFTIANNTSIQSFRAPAFPCPFVTVSYTSGGAASTLNLEYVFQNPASNNSLASLSTLATNSTSFATLSEKGGRWDVLSTPAAGSQATASKAAVSTGRHVADCISYSAGATTAPAATQGTINLRDGASGLGTILWSKTVVIPATVATHLDQNFCGLNLIGSLNTAMTLEFSAGLANEFESVTLTGYDVSQ